MLCGSVHIIGIGGNFLETGVKARSQSAAIGHGPELDVLLSDTGPSEEVAQLKKKGERGGGGREKYKFFAECEHFYIHPTHLKIMLCSVFSNGCIVGPSHFRHVMSLCGNVVGTLALSLFINKNFRLCKS